MTLAAITDYTTLKAAIGGFIPNAKIVGDGVDDIAIDMCEAELNRRLRVGEMEAIATGTMSGQTLALPTGFLEVRTFSYVPFTGGTPRALKFKPPDQLPDAGTDATGAPYYYTIATNLFAFERVPDQAYPYTVVYYKTIPALTGSATTNFLMPTHQDIYLAGSLQYAYTYLQDEQRAAFWKSVFDERVEAYKRSDGRQRFRPTEATFDATLVSVSAGSIFEG